MNSAGRVWPGVPVWDSAPCEIYNRTVCETHVYCTASITYKITTGYGTSIKYRALRSEIPNLNFSFLYQVPVQPCPTRRGTRSSGAAPGRSSRQRGATTATVDDRNSCMRPVRVPFAVHGRFVNHGCGADREMASCGGRCSVAPFAPAVGRTEPSERCRTPPRRTAAQQRGRGARL